MTTRKAHDRHGRIECDGCEELGKPNGGVTTTLNGRQATRSFALPEGWAIRLDGTLHCGACACEEAPKAENRKTA